MNHSPFSDFGIPKPPVIEAKVGKLGRIARISKSIHLEPAQDRQASLMIPLRKILA